MTIQIPNPGTGNGASGDNEFVLWSKVKDNFSDQTNAASRLVGTATGQVPLADHILNLALSTLALNKQNASSNADNFEAGTSYTTQSGVTVNSPAGLGVSYWNVRTIALENDINHFQIAHGLTANVMQTRQKYAGAYSAWAIILSTANTTKDSNGFLKGASPVVDLYNDYIEQNSDAKKQAITFEKLGIGDYLIKGSLGFAQEGWYIETPKDANGNVLVAVVYEQLANNDLSIKTYAKKFDDETGDIVANLTKPRDIPVGRFISLRLHELPKEPPSMPTETQPEV